MHGNSNDINLINNNITINSDFNYNNYYSEICW